MYQLLKVLNPDTGEEVVKHSSDEEPFAALAFKIATDPYVGKLCFFRVYSGTVDAGSTVYNSAKGKYRKNWPYPANARKPQKRYRNCVTQGISLLL